jgi:HlyD family secretion protein
MKENNMKKKHIFITIGIFVVLFFGAKVMMFMFKSGNDGGFEYEELKKGSLENIISSTGTLMAVETVEVGSQVSGIVDDLHVDFNDPVKKGQVLVVLDKTLFKVAVRDAEAGVVRARAKLDRAKAEVNRNRPLFEKGHVSEMEFLVTQTEARTAEADLKMAEASLNRAKTNLEYTVIRSPIDGTVIERTVDAGQTIAASFQSPILFVIAEDLTRMQIEANVDESDIGQIGENLSVQFTVQAYPDNTFTGKVRQIRLQPKTIQNVVNYTVIVDAPNRDRLLLPGMTATVDFIIEKVENVMLVSNKALSFTPPKELMMEMMQKRRQGNQVSSSDRGSGPISSQRGSGNPFQLPDGIGRIFLTDDNGDLSVALLKKGATDGLFTEIKEVIRGQLDMGTPVIVGIAKEKSKKSGAKNTLLPRPPGR